MLAQKKLRLVLFIVFILLVLAAIWTQQLQKTAPSPPLYTEEAVIMPAKVEEGTIAVYNGSTFVPRFWKGVDFHPSLPGFYPDDMVPNEEHYMDWFLEMKRMHVDVLRVYTLLSPHFYEALSEFNAGRSDPLYILQGIQPLEWYQRYETGNVASNDAVVEQPINLYDPLTQFLVKEEIEQTVKAIHGDLIFSRHEKADTQKYTVDVSSYVLGWLFGAPWHNLPLELVHDSNDLTTNHNDVAQSDMQVGEYIFANEQATQLELWIAQMLDHLAQVDMHYGWQHPIAFRNHLSTAPIEQDPNQTWQIDANHLKTTDAWKAGYFVSYSILQTPDSKETTLYANVGQLVQHHSPLPVLISDFGFSSSPDMISGATASISEHLQSNQLVRQYEKLQQTGVSGTIIYEWLDSWHPFDPRTAHIELPDRRAKWDNPWRVSSHYGLISLETVTQDNVQMNMDGDLEDWNRLSNAYHQETEQLTMEVTHDAAYVYIKLAALQNEEPVFSVDKDVHNTLWISFDTIDGGAQYWSEWDKLDLSDHPAEFILDFDEDVARILVNQAYDQHRWQNVDQWPLDLTLLKDDESGTFVPWMLKNETGDLVEVGRLQRFSDAEATSQSQEMYADWALGNGILELRIPWMLLGYMDPSSKQVWAYPSEPQHFSPVSSSALTISVHHASGASITVPYVWDDWEKPMYKERVKDAYIQLQELFAP